jgi:hypothetical protein
VLRLLAPGFLALFDGLLRRADDADFLPAGFLAAAFFFVFTVFLAILKLLSSEIA